MQPPPITNTGNSALTVTGYTSSNSVDYTAADTATGGCEAGSPVAAGATCTVNVTFQPGAGEQGTLTGQIGIVSTAVNSPIVIGATGVRTGAVHLRNDRCWGSQSGRGDQYATHNHCGSEEWSRRCPHRDSHGELHNLDSGHSEFGTNAGIPTITPQTATATSNLTSGGATFTLVAGTWRGRRP